MHNHNQISSRLEYLRSQIKAQCISYGEIAELQSLVDYIEPNDTLLLEWAGVPEHGEACDNCGDSVNISHNSSGQVICENCGHEEDNDE